MSGVPAGEAVDIRKSVFLTLLVGLALLSPTHQTASGHDRTEHQTNDWGFVIDDPKDRPIFIAQFVATGNEEALELLAATDQERIDAQRRIDTQAKGHEVRQRAIQEFGDAYGGAYNDGADIVILSTETREFEGARVVLTDYSISELESIADAINSDAADKRQDVQAGVVQRIGDVIVFVWMAEHANVDLSSYPQEVLEIRRGEQPVQVSGPNETHNPTADRKPGMQISIWKEDGAIG